MQEAKNFVSFLCAPPVPERSLEDNSLLRAEGDLEQRGSAAENLEPSAKPEADVISIGDENLPCSSGLSVPDAVIKSAAEDLEPFAELAKAVPESGHLLLRAEGDLG